MERVNATQAARQFSDLLNRVYYQGASFELERNNKVIARLVPVTASATIMVQDLNRLFAELPSLDEDAQTFAEDVEAIRREIPPEGDPWAS
jgi:antitoxin (DNA-binding transcriptional repressor) of toxin-antitoxin stability system